MFEDLFESDNVSTAEEFGVTIENDDVWDVSHYSYVWNTGQLPTDVWTLSS